MKHGQHRVRFGPPRQFARAFAAGWLIVSVLVAIPAAASAQLCPGDLNGDQQVTVDELVTAVTAALNGCESVTPTLNSLLGTWRFITTIDDETFEDNYRLEEVDGDFIFGTDLDQGDDIVAARTADLISDPFPYAFALLDPSDLFCDFFVFNLTGANTVTGVDYLTAVENDGTCGEIDSDAFPMTGSRVSAAASAARKAVPVDLLQLRQALRRTAAKHATASVAGPPREALTALLQALRQAAR